MGTQVCKILKLTGRAAPRDTGSIYLTPYKTEGARLKSSVCQAIPGAVLCITRYLWCSSVHHATPCFPPSLPALPSCSTHRACPSLCKVRCRRTRVQQRPSTKIGQGAWHPIGDEGWRQQDAKWRPTRATTTIPFGSPSSAHKRRG